VPPGRHELYIHVEPGEHGVLRVRGVRIEQMGTYCEHRVESAGNNGKGFKWDLSKIQVSQRDSVGP
jgi:hypothetical protein